MKHLRLSGVSLHESIKGRSAEDVASVFIRFIRKSRDIQSFIFWADLCPKQEVVPFRCIS